MVIDSYRTQLSTYESRSEQRNNLDITNKIINVKSITMKRTLLSLVAVLMVANVFAIDLKQQVKELKSMLLQTPGVSAAEIGENDKVELNYKDGYFYFTVNYINNTSLTKGLEVTLNANNYKIPEGKYSMADLQSVALYVNRTFHGVKVNIDEKNKRVTFQEEFYAKDINSLSTDVLACYLSTITKARKAYAYSIKKVKQVPPAPVAFSPATADSSDTIVVPKDDISELQLGAIVCQGVDAHNKKVLDANQFTKESLKYINFIVNLTGPKVANYTINVKIVSPKKKLMVQEDGADYSFSTPIKVQKKDKEAQYTTASFGSMKKKIWEPGHYTVFFYEGNNLLGEYKFEVKK